MAWGNAELTHIQFAIESDDRDVDVAVRLETAWAAPLDNWRGNWRLQSAKVFGIGYRLSGMQPGKGPYVVLHDVSSRWPDAQRWLQDKLNEDNYKLRVMTSCPDSINPEHADLMEHLDSLYEREEEGQRWSMLESRRGYSRI